MTHLVAPIECNNCKYFRLKNNSLKFSSSRPERNESILKSQPAFSKKLVQCEKELSNILKLTVLFNITTKVAKDTPLYFQQ